MPATARDAAALITDVDRVVSNVDLVLWLLLLFVAFIQHLALHTTMAQLIAFVGPIAFFAVATRVIDVVYLGQTAGDSAADRVVLRRRQLLYFYLVNPLICGLILPHTACVESLLLVLEELVLGLQKVRDVLDVLALQVIGCGIRVGPPPILIGP